MQKTKSNTNKTFVYQFESFFLIESATDNHKFYFSDKDYISKKYDISKSEFDAMLNTPAKTYKDFPNDKKRIERFYRLYKKIFN